MAASFPTSYNIETVDIKLLHGVSLEPLLDEQQQYWWKHFRWDFTPSRQLITQCLDMRSLSGAVLTNAGRPVGYSFFVQEGYKALIGDLFLNAEYRNSFTERFLFERVFHLATNYPGIQRVEGQLLTLSSPLESESICNNQLQMYRRLFMMTTKLGQTLEARPTKSNLQFDCWATHYSDSAAHLITHTYMDHIDSRINNQYSNYTGARRFLDNTLHQSGCGTFCQAASLVALHRPSQEVRALCLASLVGPRIGHITQLCVAPHLANQGLGYELLRRSLGTFRELGCEAVGLTVTELNKRAVQLYEGIGFRTIHRFQACVWESLDTV